MTAYQVVNAVNLLFAGLAVYLMLRRRPKPPIFVPLVTWLVHAIIYNLFMIVRPHSFPVEWINYWSSALRLHSLFAVLTVSVFHYITMGKRRRE